MDNAAQTRLVVGLGNPGPRYAANRHNIGFMVLDELAARLDVRFVAADNGLEAVADDLVLLKPMTYMNLSGEAVAAWSRRAGVPVTGIPPRPDREPDEDDADGAGVPGPPCGAIRPLVVCDDLALPLGSVRLRARGSSGGQNGLASIIDHVAGAEFPRLRLGIAPRDTAVDPAVWPDYVLADFADDEAAVVRELVEHAADAVLNWRAKGLEDTVSRFNRRIRPAD